MPNRIIKDSILTSSDINALTAEEENLFYRLIVSCDDFGRFDGRTEIIRAHCYPLRLDAMTVSRVDKNLKRLASCGLVQFYEVDGKRFLCLPSWDRHQQRRASRSKYPDPSLGCSLSDINGNHLKSNDITCPRTRNRESNSKSRIEESRNREMVKPMFDEFWSLYPKKRAKLDAEKAFFKLKLDENRFREILEAVKLQAQSADWQKEGGKYIPNAAKWLNGHRWEDQISGGADNATRNPVSHRVPSRYTKPDEIYKGQDS